MKVRIGFVSNSSTSSFAIVGRVLPIAEAMILAKANPKKFKIEGGYIGSEVFAIEFLGEDGDECVIGIGVVNASLANIINAFGVAKQLFGEDEVKLLCGWSDMGGYTGLE